MNQLSSFDRSPFESRMRSQIVNSARSLNASGAKFETFKDSYANPQFWTVTNNGGFQQNVGVLPSDAINDIFINGHLYGFECATAMVIVLYKATLDTIGKEAFNAHFQNLFLHDWNYDSDLRLTTVNDLDKAQPGDVLYFKNPDHAPERPEWQGENVILLANDLFYGHGLGIASGKTIIDGLNSARRPGSTTSSYLTDQVTYPDFEYLSTLQPSTARIGTITYRYLLG